MDGQTDGCVSACAGQDGSLSLIAPLLFVLIKVSCDRMNVTNVFAGTQVRDPKVARSALTTTRWPPRLLGEAAGAGGERGAGAVPVQRCRGAGSPWQPCAVSRSRCAARLPSPSRTHLHLQPRLLPAAPPAASGGWWGRWELGAAVQQRTGVFRLLRKEGRNVFLCLGAACHRLRHPHAPIAPHLALRGDTLSLLSARSSSASSRFKSRLLL